MIYLKSKACFNAPLSIFAREGFFKAFFHVMRVSIYASSMVVASCSANQGSAIPYFEATTGDVVFDCFQVNHAWGYQLSGFFIDRLGDVYRYNHNGLEWKPKRIMQGKQTFYEGIDLIAKFANKIRVNHIDMAILGQKIALIDGAASGTVSYHKERVADAGQNVCIAYRYVATQNLYQLIELGSSGITQIRTVNNSPAAQALMQWLATGVLTK